MMILGLGLKPLLLILGGVVTVGVALAVALPLTLGRDAKQEWRGSEVLDEVPLIDGHNDLPWNLYNLEKNQLDNFNLDANLMLHPVWGPRTSSHTDLPRLREGKLGAQFWVAYVGCDTSYKDAVERTIEQIDVAKRIIEKYPDDMQYVTDADGIMSAFEAGKIGSLICVEGGHSIDSRLATLRLFYELGVRYMTLTHSCNTPWADASPIDVAEETITRKHLTEFGIQVVLEMNRLGMMVDLSHVSHGVMDAALDVTRSPVIFSHSQSYSVNAHHRNVRDDILQKMKLNGGIIMVNFYPVFLGGNTLEKVVEHLNYIKDLVGPDHIGIGGDFDGVGETPVGLEDVSKYPALFDALAQQGLGYEPWTREELQKLAGLNLLRVLREVERVRDSLKSEKPYEGLVPYDDLINEDPDTACRSDVNTLRPLNTRVADNPGDYLLPDM